MKTPLATLMILAIVVIDLTSVHKVACDVVPTDNYGLKPSSQVKPLNEGSHAALPVPTYNLSAPKPTPGSIGSASNNNNYCDLYIMRLTGTCIPSPYQCTYALYYQPVCGTDGKTYINIDHLTCEAFNNRDVELKLLHEGACVVVTTEYPFAELDNENETLSLSGSNVTLDDLTESLAKLNISVEEMKAALTELNMTLADLNVSSTYLQDQQTNQEYRPGSYDRYGPPYGYDSDEFGDFSIEFGRLIMTAAIARAIKHQMDKKHKVKYGEVGGYGGTNYDSGYGGGRFGGIHKQPTGFAGSSITALHSYGFKPSVVKPPPYTPYQPPPAYKPSAPKKTISSGSSNSKKTGSQSWWQKIFGSKIGSRGGSSRGGGKRG